MIVSLIHVHDHIWHSDWDAEVVRVASQLVWNLLAEVDPLKGLPDYMTNRRDNDET